MIHLACTNGNIGYWSYYSTVMKIRDIVENNRIIIVSESEELYSKSINAILQREISIKRIGAISEYIKNVDERFFSNIIVAIHKGTPKWTEVDISTEFKIDADIMDDESVDFLNRKFGVLSLTGNEEIFALDGQHRLVGLRNAYKEDSSIGDLEIPITFVIHNHEKLEKTRRLFTVLNKYAEKPKGAELIILDEDDAAAINTRKLVTEHPILSIEGALSSSKSGSISSSDNKSFTTLVTINNINKALYKQPKEFYTIRPSEEELERLYTISCDFWNTLFENFSELADFINGNIDIEINSEKISRDNPNGGNLLLRPTGQELIAFAYTNFEDNEKEDFNEKIKLIDFNLSSVNWKYIFWNEKMLGKNIKLKKSLVLYLLGKDIGTFDINEEIKNIYEQYNLQYSNDLIQPL